MAPDSFAPGCREISAIVTMVDDNNGAGCSHGSLRGREWRPMSGQAALEQRICCSVDAGVVHLSHTHAITTTTHRPPMPPTVGQLRLQVKSWPRTSVLRRPVHASRSGSLSVLHIRDGAALAFHPMVYFTKVVRQAVTALVLCCP